MISGGHQDEGLLTEQTRNLPGFGGSVPRAGNNDDVRIRDAEVSCEFRITFGGSRLTWCCSTGNQQLPSASRARQPHPLDDPDEPILIQGSRDRHIVMRAEAAAENDHRRPWDSRESPFIWGISRFQWTQERVPHQGRGERGRADDPGNEQAASLARPADSDEASHRCEHDTRKERHRDQPGCHFRERG